MSAAHDAHADASAAHDAHDHFDNEPATELGADEPRTPNWIPMLGMALFFIAGITWLFSGGEDKPTEDKPAGVEAAAVAQPTPPTPAPQLRPAPLNAAPAQPGQANALNKLSPEQAKELQKQIDARRAAQGNQPAAPKQPAAAPHPPHPGHEAH
jgi:hypothetical protein